MIIKRIYENRASGVGGSNWPGVADAITDNFLKQYDFLVYW